MKLGVALPLAGNWATPENQSLIAQRAEALAYHSVWVFQRLFYALAPQNDYPPGNAKDLVEIALTLHRLPGTRARGLDLFERLMTLDAYGAQESLSTLDRHPFR